MIHMEECVYDGEVDEEGRACGYGHAEGDDGTMYAGTFVDDRLEGKGKFKNFLMIYDSEFYG